MNKNSVEEQIICCFKAFVDIVDKLNKSYNEEYPKIERTDDEKTTKVTITMPRESCELIGKKYIVKDNSYIVDLQNKNVKHTDLYGKEMIIIAEPFIKKIHNDFDDFSYEVYMVEVISPITFKRYQVLFNESCIVD